MRIQHVALDSSEANLCWSLSLVADPLNPWNTFLSRTSPEDTLRSLDIRLDMKTRLVRLCRELNLPVYGLRVQVEARLRAHCAALAQDDSDHTAQSPAAVPTPNTMVASIPSLSATATTLPTTAVASLHAGALLANAASIVDPTMAGPVPASLQAPSHLHVQLPSVPVTVTIATILQAIAGYAHPIQVLLYTRQPPCRLSPVTPLHP